MTAAFTIRLDDEMLAKLDALAADTDRSRNWIAAKAIESYVELNAWQIQRIKEGIAEADRGEFATEEEVESVFRKYKATAE
ncbi:CopG family ribbon-helix-helix protein [Bosea sp. RAF48]|uniref:CopG family ribbon-helix-helix protein n=1 Tax=Bosea sp. RAF48 TaxID=3237480 RepID=UPI003F8DC8F2